MTTSRRVALAIFLFLWTMSTHGKPSVAGDEPYYLMAAHSIVVDNDLDLTNNFANNDGRFFGASGLDTGGGMSLPLVAAPYGRLMTLGSRSSSRQPTRSASRSSN